VKGAPFMFLYWVSCGLSSLDEVTIPGLRFAPSGLPMPLALFASVVPAVDQAADAQERRAAAPAPARTAREASDERASKEDYVPRAAAAHGAPRRTTRQKGQSVDGGDPGVYDGIYED
jgi:hypothetical protein